MRPVKKVCPGCGREAEVLFDQHQNLVWAYHDANPPQRALCEVSTKQLATHAPLAEVLNLATEDTTTIDVLFAFIAKDEDGEEGIIAAPVNGQVMPLIGADLDRMGSLIPYAQLAANVRRQPVRLVLFSQPTVLDTLQPT